MKIEIDLSPEIKEDLENRLLQLKKKWDEEHKGSKKPYVLDSAIFLMSSLDDLIIYAQKHIEKGSDKKQVVMAMSGNIFDHMVKSSFPIWIVPLIPVIKKIVIDVVLSEMIEFIVKKYNEGQWLTPIKINFPDMPQDSIAYRSLK